jgi:hypothetical protein
MTKKDYIAIADAIREARKDATTAQPDSASVSYGIDLVQREIVRVLRADNPRFDADRFHAYIER